MQNAECRVNNQRAAAGYASGVGMSKTFKVIAISAVLIAAAVICLSFFEMPAGWWTRYGGVLTLALCVLWPVTYIWSMIILVRRKNWITILVLTVFVLLFILSGLAPGGFLR